MTNSPGVSRAGTVSLPFAEPPRLRVSKPLIGGLSGKSGSIFGTSKSLLPCLLSSLIPLFIAFLFRNAVCAASRCSTAGRSFRSSALPKNVVSFSPEPTALSSIPTNLLLSTVNFASAFGMLPAPFPNNSSKAFFDDVGLKSNLLCFPDLPFVSALTFLVAADMKPSKALPAIVFGCILSFMDFFSCLSFPPGIAFDMPPADVANADWIMSSVKVSKPSFTDFTKSFSISASRYLTWGLPLTVAA